MKRDRDGNHLNHTCCCSCTWDGLIERRHKVMTATSYIAAPSLRFNPAGYYTTHFRGTAICGLRRASPIIDGPWNSKRGTCMGQHAITTTTRTGTEVVVDRTNKLDVSALGLVSPLGGGTGLSALNALHSTVVIRGLGGLQQLAQLNGLLRGGTDFTSGVSNALAGLCALPGGSQSQQVTLNAM